MKNLIRFDWAVKRLLRNKANFGILEGFLSELLGYDLTIEQILESEGNRQTSDNKTNRVDILVKNTKGELIIIEIQNNYMQDYLLRMLYGTSKIIIDNMIKGMDYGNIKKVISINIVYFDLGRGQDYVYHGTTSYEGLHKKDTLALSVAEENIYQTIDIAKIYPEYYIIKVNQFDNVSKNTLDEWINFLKNQEVNEETKAKGLKEASIELNIMSLNPEEKEEYDNYIKDSRDNYGVIVGNYNKGIYDGRKELIKALHKNGMKILEIAKMTEISEEEVVRILSENI